MQVWITGHVPPSPGNYFPDCYVRYVELSLRFQDTILGHLYGHMNADHFSFLEAIDLQIAPEKDEESTKHDLYDTLLQEYATLPRKPKDVDFADYAVVNVAPPVVPNPYLPGFRVYAYNISASDDTEMMKSILGKKRRHGHRRGDHGDKASYCRKEMYRESWKCSLNESWNSDPESPSRKNKKWTPLGYAQYYIPDLEKANETHAPHFKLEYLTFAATDLHPRPSGGHSSIVYPMPLRLLPRSLRNANVTSSKYTPYGMGDLTIGSWIRLGQRLGDEKEKRVRKRYRRYMYMDGG